MLVGEAIFWISLTIFGTGVYFMLETKTKARRKRLGIALVCISVAGMTVPVIRHFANNAAAASPPPNRAIEQATANNRTILEGQTSSSRVLGTILPSSETATQ